MDLDLRVERGELFGVLGPNGAGRQPLIRVMLGLILPTAGRVSLLGFVRRMAQLWHEQPVLHPFDQTELEAGMVLMLEPPIITSEGLYHTEDMIEMVALVETAHRDHLNRHAD